MTGPETLDVARDAIWTIVVVSSSLDPHRTFIDLVGTDLLPGDFVDDVRRYKFRGSSGKVNMMSLKDGSVGLCALSRKSFAIMMSS